jgi:L-fuculose-phosphate aldolase
MGAMGNISLRDPDRREMAWIKRSGVWLERAKPSDFLRVNIAHPEPKIARKISKEINLHLGCLRARPDINAVIHTHPAMVTGLATAGVDLGRKMAKIRSKIRSKIETIKYYQPGSKTLAEAVQKAIKRANAVAMANHGLVVVGKSLKEAYQRTLIIEREAARLIRKSF